MSGLRSFRRTGGEKLRGGRSSPFPTELDRGLGRSLDGSWPGIIDFGLFGEVSSILISRGSVFVAYLGVLGPREAVRDCGLAA